MNDILNHFGFGKMFLAETVNNGFGVFSDEVYLEHRNSETKIKPYLLG
jgi:hypothetical protein